MADSVNMSLDEIIRASRSRGRGGTKARGRGGGIGRGRGRGRGARAASRAGSSVRSRSRSRSRSQSMPQAEARGRRGRGARGARGRRQSRARSRSRSRFAQRPRSASRSRSRSRQRPLTPRGRVGLDSQYTTPIQNRIGNYRGGLQTQVRRSRSNSNLRGDVHSRLGVATRRGMANNVRKPLAVAKRGISKRGRGLTTRNRYSTVGLRSDQIIQEQQRNQNNIIKSQTFTRSRNNSLSRDTASLLTISVANNLAKRRRRNSVGNPNYLDRESLMQLTRQLGGFNTRRGPGSVSSVGSTRSTRSNRSGGARSRGRGRGRGRSRGRALSRNFGNRPVLNDKLQKEIAAIQGKASNGAGSESPSGINFTPTPASTKQTLHQRFAST